ncbi:MAG TPA: HAD family phosphatase [Candidatus Peribacteria bacterium]|nr:HAD family phosphatase [Candidatus Peribacteria bacterium]
MHTYDAILFDLDGTLVDTIDLYKEACLAALGGAGLRFTTEDFARLYPTACSFSDWVIHGGGKEEHIEPLRGIRDNAYCALLRERTVFLDGAEELLTALTGRPMAIVTGSWKSYVDAIDEKLKVSRRVGHLITADDMGDFHKPHPHGLFLAADRLGVDPAKCLYVGDQMFDVGASRAAGMKSCCMVSRHTPAQAIAEADMVVRSLPELTGLLAK